MSLSPAPVRLRSAPPSRRAAEQVLTRAQRARFLFKTEQLWKPVLWRAVGAGETGSGETVITLTRLNDDQVTVNADLIVFLESSPETTLTLMNGERMKIRESVEEVCRSVLEYKHSVVRGQHLGEHGS